MLYQHPLVADACVIGVPDEAQAERMKAAADELVTVAAELNARPRKTLDWVTPADHLVMLLKTTCF